MTETTSARAEAMLHGYLTAEQRRGFVSKEVNENAMSNPQALAYTTFGARHGEFMDEVAGLLREALDASREGGIDDDLDARIEAKLAIIDAAESEVEDA